MNDLPLEDFEPGPVPAENETPRQFLLRVTGYDFDSLEGCPWEYVREYPPMMTWFTNVMMRHHHPRIIVRRK